MHAMAGGARKHPRVPAQGLAAHLRIGRGRVTCVVENISLDGLFVRTDQVEEVGAEVSVDLVKPGWKKRLTLSARITSQVDALEQGPVRRPPGLEIEFTELDEPRRERLAALLRELGDPDEQAQVTAPNDSLEEKLRALEDSLPPAVTPGSPEADPGAENARLQLQLRGLVMQLSDAQQLVVERDEEIERLREELETVRAALARALGTQ